MRTQWVQSTRASSEILELGAVVVRTDELSPVKAGDAARVTTSDGQTLRGVVTAAHLDGLSCLMSAHIHIDIDQE